MDYKTKIIKNKKKYDIYSIGRDLLGGLNYYKVGTIKETLGEYTFYPSFRTLSISYETLDKINDKLQELNQEQINKKDQKGDYY